MMRTTLRRTRLERGLTQEAVAARVGIRRAYYQQIEVGRRTPSLPVAFRIATVLQADPRDLFPVDDITYTRLEGPEKRHGGGEER